MSQPIVHIYPGKEEVAANFAAYLYKAINQQEKYYLALSGGSTPKVLFDYLAKHYVEQIDWRKVYLFWGDERCVPPTDDDSNFKMTKEYLLDHVDIPESNIFRVHGEAVPEEEAERYAAESLGVLPQKGGLPIFDLVMLGMGGDGHTASIFPHQMELLTVTDHCAVATHPESDQQRVTLTGPVINAAKEVAFLVTGASKQEKIQAIFNKEENYLDYPAAHINPKEGKLSWWMDEAAQGSN